MKTIYLAGGTHSNWQSKVMEVCIPGHTVLVLEFIDPRKNKQLIESDQFTFWDLEAIRICDYVFAYMEKDNPSGAGMIYEMGYAKGLGKPVFFVNEKKDKYHNLAIAHADVVFDALEDGIRFLQHMTLIA